MRVENIGSKWCVCERVVVVVDMGEMGSKVA